MGHYAIREKIILQDIQDDNDWVEDLTSPRLTWSAFQAVVWLPINDQESNENRSGTPNMFDNTYDQMVDRSPLDRSRDCVSETSEEQLSDYLSDLDHSDDDQTLYVGILP